MEFCKNCGAEVNGAFCSSCGAEVKGTLCSSRGTKSDYGIAPNQKEDLKGSIESLYCLRAGLSMVSLESDKVEKEKDFVKNAIACRDMEKSSLQDNLDSNEKAIKKLERNLERENAKIREENQKRIRRIDGCKAVIEDWEKNTKKIYNRQRVLFRTFVSMFAVGLPMFAVMAALAGTQGNVFFIFPMVLGALSCGVGFWGTIIMLVVLRLNSKKAEKKSFDEATVTLKKLEEEQPKELKSIQSVFANNEEYQGCIKEIQKYNSEIAQLDAKHQIKEKSDSAIKNIKAYSEKGNELYNALVDTYSHVLDPRDWEHIDLIIYILETGRADSFKEALQQLDLFRHTDKIVKAVKDANTAICSTIRSEINKLGTAFVICANSISTKLDRIALSQDKISDSLNKSVSASSLQTALLEKSVISSNELLKSVNVIKDYAEDTNKISQDIKTIHNYRSGYLY